MLVRVRRRDGSRYLAEVVPNPHRFDPGSPHRADPGTVHDVLADIEADMALMRRWEGVSRATNSPVRRALHHLSRARNYVIAIREPRGR
jgi:hypothetical protein